MDKIFVIFNTWCIFYYLVYGIIGDFVKMNDKCKCCDEFCSKCSRLMETSIFGKCYCTNMKCPKPEIFDKKEIELMKVYNRS